MEKARNNLYAMLNWFYQTKSKNLPYNLIQKTILKDLIDFIVGPNDLVRDEVKIIIIQFCLYINIMKF